MTSTSNAEDLEAPPTETTPLINKQESESSDDPDKPSAGKSNRLVAGLAVAGGAVSSVAQGTATGIKRTVSGVGNVTVSAVSAAESAVSAAANNTVSAAGYAAHGWAKTGSTLETGYGSAMNWYDKLFLKDVNPNFGDAMEVASRGACFVVICALPFILPNEVCPKCQKLIASEYYTSTCVVYFIYTLYLHTGDTIHFAQGGIGGTIMAVLNCWLMQGFMPGGYHPLWPERWYFGIVWGISFVFLVLWLNFDDITRIFALSTFVWYWMAFLEPGFNWGFARNFQVRMDGVAFKELAIAFIGCFIAGVAGFVPYPIFAHRKARNISKSMVEQIFMAKKDFLKYYSGDHSDSMAVKVLSTELEAIRAQVDKLPGLLDSAWYESFGNRKWVIQRRMMRRYKEYVSTTCDRLANLFLVCLSETFDDQHNELMAVIEEPMHRVVDYNAEVLTSCVEILFAGKMHEDWAKRAEVNIALSEKAVEDLTDAFTNERDTLDKNVVGGSMSGENVVGITLCKFTEMTKDFYGHLQMIAEGTEKEQRSWRQGDGALGLFEPDLLFGKDHLMWVLRNSLSIILSFFIGLHGYNRYIQSYNANIAGTVSVLLSSFAGSAALKNLGRLQGVVIGIVLGNLLYALFGWCYWWAHLCVAVVLYLWSLIGLFMYYHSVNYSTVGLLLVVFGSKSLLNKCSNELTDPKGYKQIVDVTVAVVVMTIVDNLLSPARASDLAKKAFHDAYMPLIASLNDLFDKKEPRVRRQMGALLRVINKAQLMGDEASLEPRFWRNPWPQTSFNVAVNCIGSLRFSMNSMEINALNDYKEVGEKGRTKKKEFMHAISLDSFMRDGGVRDLLILHCAGVFKAVEASLGDNATHDIFKVRLTKLESLEQSKMAMDRRNSARSRVIGRKISSLEDIGSADVTLCHETACLWEEALDEFAEELNLTIPELEKSGELTPRAKSLSEDVYADVCMIVESLRSMFTELDTVLRTISA
jgi:uncharacterized membrane protein YgaE (UPF0421/DUF939 family)